MALTCNGSTSRLKWAGNIVSSYPMSMFCWIKPSSVAAGGSGASLGLLDNTAYNLIFLAANNDVRARSRDTSAGVAEAISGTLVDLVNWQPCLAVFTSVSSRTIYYAAALGVTDTVVTIIDNSASFDTAGASFDAALLTGDIAELAFWSTALTAANFTTLSGDVKPETVAAGSFVEGWPLRTQAASQTGTISRTLTATSTTQAATHPITRAAFLPFPAPNVRQAVNRMSTY